jgi:Ca-activated chloride channel family protein
VSFAWPALLVGLLALPIGALAYRAATRRRPRYAVNYSNVDVLRTVATGPRSWRRAVPAGLYALGAAVILVALARPYASVAVPRQDATVVLVMDTSSSMLSDDVPPSRLDAATASATSFVGLVPPAFRLAVVAFSDAAAVVRPPTTNHGAVVRSLEALVAGGGTAMGDGLAKALDLVDEQAASGERSPQHPLFTVLLLSDGRNTGGDLDPVDAAARARERGVPVFTIALGARHEPLGSISVGADPPDRPTLREIARVTGGEYFSAATEDRLRRVYDDLSARIGYVHRDREVTSLFAAAAAVLLIAAVATSLLWRSRFP